MIWNILRGTRVCSLATCKGWWLAWRSHQSLPYSVLKMVQYLKTLCTQQIHKMLGKHELVSGDLPLELGYLHIIRCTCIYRRLWTCLNLHQRLYTRTGETDSTALRNSPPSLSLPHLLLSLPVSLPLSLCLSLSLTHTMSRVCYCVLPS